MTKITNYQVRRTITNSAVCMLTPFSGSMRMLAAESSVAYLLSWCSVVLYFAPDQCPTPTHQTSCEGFRAHKKDPTSCAGYLTIKVPDFVQWIYQLIKSTRLRELRTWRRWLRISPCLLNCCQTSGRLPIAQQLKKARAKTGMKKTRLAWKCRTKYT